MRAPSLRLSGVTVVHVTCDRNTGEVRRKGGPPSAPRPAPRGCRPPRGCRVKRPHRLCCPGNAPPLVRAARLQGTTADTPRQPPPRCRPRPRWCRRRRQRGLDARPGIRRIRLVLCGRRVDAPRGQRARSGPPWYESDVTHDQALAAIHAVLAAAPGPVSVAVVDDHGEVVACIAMDGAARDTLENARRKAYTAARSDATVDPSARREGPGGADRARELRPAVLVLPRRRGGALAGDRRLGAVGVSGLPGAEDERLAIAAVARVGARAGRLTSGRPAGTTAFGV